MKSLSRVQLCIPMDCSLPGSSIHGIFHFLPSISIFHGSRLPFPSPRDLPDPRIEPRSSALQADALLSEPPGSSFIHSLCYFLPHPHDIQYLKFLNQGLNPHRLQCKPGFLTILSNAVNLRYFQNILS